jgi:hypothetical protein
MTGCGEGTKGEKKLGPGRGFLGRGRRDLPGKRGSLEKFGLGERVTTGKGGSLVGSELKADGRGLCAMERGGSQEEFGGGCSLNKGGSDSKIKGSLEIRSLLPFAVSHDKVVKEN